MKKLLKVFISCLLLINIFSINNVYAVSTAKLFISYGQDTIVYEISIESSQEDMEPIVGNKIEGIQVDYNEDYQEYIIYPTNENVVLDDFNMYCDVGIRIYTYQHGLTINSHIHSFSYGDYQLPAACIYTSGSFTVVGGGSPENTFNLNFDASRDFYESTPFASAAIQCGDFNIGNDEMFAFAHIIDTTSPEILNNINSSAVVLPVKATGYANIIWAEVNIESYTCGIDAVYGVISDYSKINLLRLGGPINNCVYTGIKSEYTSVYDRTDSTPVYSGTHIETVLTIKEDENTKNYKVNKAYGFYVKNTNNSLIFNGCILDIDLRNAQGVAFDMGETIIEGKPENSPLYFVDTYADIYGSVFFHHQGEIRFSGSECNVAITSNTYTIDSESADSIINFTDKEGLPTVMIRTTNNECCWCGKGYISDNVYGFKGAAASKSVDAQITEAYEPSSLHSYRFVAQQKPCAVSYEGGLEQKRSTFTKLKKPADPECPDGMIFVGWQYVYHVPHDRYTEPKIFDFDDYVRVSMNLQPVFIKQPIDKVVFDKVENYIEYFEYYFYNIDQTNYEIIDRESYAYFDNECTYYTNCGCIYNYETKEPLDEYDIAIPMSSDTFVYITRVKPSDWETTFSDNLELIIGDTTFNPISKDKLVNEKSTCSIDETYQGYYLDDDKQTLYIQSVINVPESHFVDRIDVKQATFDFENIDYELELTEGFGAIGAAVFLANGQEKVAVAEIFSKDEKYYYDPIEFEDMDRDDIGEFDRVVVVFFIEPTTYGPFYDPDIRLFYDDEELIQDRDFEKLLVENLDYDGEISKDLNEFALDDEDVLGMYLQLYFEIEEEPTELKEIPLVLPDADKDGILPYYEDGKGCYYEDPEGKSPIDDIDEWKENEGKIAKLSEENKKQLTITPNQTIVKPVSNNKYVFECNTEYDNFICVLIDGAIVPEDVYTKQKGSTIIIFKDEYINNKLNVGNHTIQVISKEGFGQSTFEVKQNSNPGGGGGSSYVIPTTGIR